LNYNGNRNVSPNPMTSRWLDTPAESVGNGKNFMVSAQKLPARALWKRGLASR
jgi:hypothetical protein